MSTATAAQRRFKRLFAYPAQAVLVYALFYFFKLLPLDTASALGGRILRFVGPKLGATKKVRRNIDNALRGLSVAEQDVIISGMWDNLGRIMAEYPHLDEMEGARTQVVGREHLEAAVGKPLIVVSGHLANWEVLPVTAAKQGLILQLVYRHANNPYVEKLLRKARTPSGGKLARKGVEGARSVHGALKNNQAVAMLIDQKHNKGLPIPFFGRPAMTAPAVAELALRYNAPIILTLIERTNGANFKMTVQPPLAMPVGMREEDAVRDILTRLNAQLEDFIRANPAQWLWLHRRWAD
jgi:Kdo2-lipid IVA lauroyltransferase/acyltransferase